MCYTDNMQLENYFDFLAENDIRIRGTRVGIETILFDYLDLGMTPEQIAYRYPTVTIEQVYATVTYYWGNQAVIERYLQRTDEEVAASRAAQERLPSPAVARLRQLARQRELIAA